MIASDSILPLSIFTLLILAFLLLDLFVIHSKSKAMSMKEALLWCAFWECLTLLFAAYVFYSRGWPSTLDFYTGYLIEKSLSMDNLFVFALIFRYFQTPKEAMHHVLFLGFLGAMVMRAILIIIGIELISKFHWLIYILGIFLIYTGIRLYFEKDKEIHPEKNVVLNLYYRFFPVKNDYKTDQFFVLENGRYIATPLFVTVLMVETVDLVFALDSIPAILAITLDPFIVYTSNIFAILGLRSLFFVISHLLTAFHYFHHGLAFILVFIGFKMVISGYVHIPTMMALGVVVCVLATSIAASVLIKPKERF